jgi:serine/threonine-protein kinase
MSPEQFRSSKAVDARTDIWALGTILYELVTGRAPFTASSVTELAIRIATEPVRSPLELRSELPPALASVILTCLEKEPERRFTNVGALASALGPFASPVSRASIDRIAGILGQQSVAHASTEAMSTSPVSREPAVAATGPRPPEDRTTSGVQRTWHESEGKPGARGRLLVGAALGVGALGVAALAAAWWRAPEAPAAAQLATTSASTGAPTTSVSPPPTASSPPEPPVAPASASAAPVTAEPAPTARAPAPKPAAPRKGTAAGSKAAQPAPAKTTPTPRPAAPARVSCDPPFYFDSAGNRVFKQECL